MNSKKGINRRRFVKAAATSTAALSVAPGSVLGRPGRIAPNDKLNLACVGMGYQGLRMMADLLKRPDVRVVAVCDPNTESDDYIGWGRPGKDSKGMPGGREVGRRKVEEHYAKATTPGKYKGCNAYADFREMLEREKDLDAVTIITPDHLHATIAIAAMKKGVHAATHKPISNVMYETRLTCDTARQTGRATHLHAWQEIKSLYTIRDWIRQGAIGTVRELHRWLYKPIWPQGAPDLPTDNPPVPPGFDWGLWLGPERDRPYSPRYTHAVYRGWYDFGAGSLADMGNYGLWMDWRILGLGAPTSAEACSSFTCSVEGFRGHQVKNEVSYPHASTIHFRHPARGAAPARDAFWYDGGMRPRTPEALAAAGEQLPKVGVMFVGDEGVILADWYYERPRILPEKRGREIVGSLKSDDIEVIDPTDEWVQAFRGGKPSRGNFQNAQPLAETICLGNVAVRTNARVEWDAAKMAIANLPEANQYLRRNYRQGWEL